MGIQYGPLDEDTPFNLNDPDWRIFTRNPNQPAQYISPSGKVRNCIISEGTVVHGEVNHSVLFYGIEVGENSAVIDSVIMPRVKIGQNVRIYRAIIAEGLVIPDGTQISPAPEDESDILLVDQEELERQLRQGITSKA